MISTCSKCGFKKVNTIKTALGMLCHYCCARELENQLDIKTDLTVKLKKILTNLNRIIGEV